MITQQLFFVTEKREIPELLFGERASFCFMAGLFILSFLCIKVMRISSLPEYMEM